MLCPRGNLRDPARIVASMSSMQSFLFRIRSQSGDHLLQNSNFLDRRSSSHARRRGWRPSSRVFEFHDRLPGSIETRQGFAGRSTALGDNIHLRSTALGIALRSAGSEFVQFSVSLAGSHGAGRVYAVANTTNRALEFSRLSFLPAAGRQPIDLTPAPQRLDLPPVPPKKVYLLPLGLDDSEPLDWCPSYYRAKFGIEVVVLPSAQLKEQLINPTRKQVDSEAAIEYVRKLQPELDADPSAILIAVTSKDIYIPSFNWTYVENYRRGARFAVVSSARLHPPAFMAGWNPEWLRSRLQKMLTKNIAMLYFDLPMSSDYTSLLSGGVLYGPQIDFMGGTIIGAERRWDSFINGNDPGVAIYSVPGKPPLWRLRESDDALPQHGAHVFRADLGTGLFIDRTEDFRLEGEYPLEFTRSYRNADILNVLQHI